MKAHEELSRRKVSNVYQTQNDTVTRQAFVSPARSNALSFDFARNPNDNQVDRPFSTIDNGGLAKSMVSVYEDKASDKPDRANFEDI